MLWETSSLSVKSPNWFTIKLSISSEPNRMSLNFLMNLEMAIPSSSKNLEPLFVVCGILNSLTQDKNVL